MLYLLHNKEQTNHLKRRNETMTDIELVIKIPEEVYEHILKTKSIPDMLGIDIVNTINAVKIGTPLPKGHGDLIDRNALEYEIASIEGYSELDYECVEKEDIEQAPVIIEADEAETDE